ncbi:curli-like amyloid fiber formation chaperone CsgH [Roseovarius salinarum]|uniref:curli-like amyloid fiber formation chaperone CsgH n=1 Tax=Roseovarius salinarum TaxID=1981892 RepID=UPI0012FFDDB0|nr:curli-like amyloid fiber formation chaperone CsgH [Roseovarius salinarum]
MKTLFHTFVQGAPLAACALAAAVGAAALAGQTTNATAGGTAQDAPVRCAIAIRDLGGSVEISGKVKSDVATHGHYEMTIRQSSGAGSTMIDQSGDFTLGAGRMTTLGQAVLGGTPGSYDVDLHLDVDGQRLRCAAQDDAADI